MTCVALGGFYFYLKDGRLYLNESDYPQFPVNKIIFSKESPSLVICSDTGSIKLPDGISSIHVYPE